MGPTMIAICERETRSEILRYKEEIIEVFVRNGLDGKFLTSVRNGAYDNRIAHEILCNTGMSASNFVKKLLNDEIW